MRRLLSLIVSILTPKQETATDRIRYLRRSGATKWWR
jgi:hypothetical protein